MADDIVRIDVRWPAQAKAANWRITEVVAVDENGIAHMVEIVGASIGIKLKRRLKI